MKMIKIFLLGIGILLVVAACIYKGNSIIKTALDIILPRKYKKYIDVNKNPISSGTSMMSRLPEGENQTVMSAFLNSKNELIFSTGGRFLK